MHIPQTAQYNSQPKYAGRAFQPVLPAQIKFDLRSCHDNSLTCNPTQPLTRSVGVICLSQYLQSNLDSLIVINNQLKPLKTTVTSGSGQLTAQMTLFTFARTCKYCAIPACHRDSFPTHNRDKKPAGCASNANSLNCRAVSCKTVRHCTWTSDAQARVLQPVPATVPTLQNTCFFAT